ncbi:hypothetical protein GCM10027269_73750 [Kribbella endophytica]
MVSRGVEGVQVGLLGVRQAVAERGLGLEGIHIAREGEEPVSFRWGSDDRRDVYSVSKTFTSVAVGIARAEGLPVDHADRAAWDEVRLSRDQLVPPRPDHRRRERL